jgi:hypothetical protein
VSTVHSTRVDLDLHAERPQPQHPIHGTAPGGYFPWVKWPELEADTHLNPLPTLRISAVLRTPMHTTSCHTGSILPSVMTRDRTRFAEL